MPLSVIILTRNEEANIGACLASVEWASVSGPFADMPSLNALYTGA
jgi:glycosyltransferase involved in cell wall biosynthesis